MEEGGRQGPRRNEHGALQKASEPWLAKPQEQEGTTGDKWAPSLASERVSRGQRSLNKYQQVILPQLAVLLTSTE